MRLLFLLPFICCSACGAAQPAQPPALISIIQYTAAGFTDGRFSLDSMARLLRLADTAIMMSRETRNAENGVPADTAYYFFTRSGNAERPVLRVFAPAAAIYGDSLKAIATFFVAGGYTAEGGQVRYELQDMHAVSIADLEKAFGRYTGDMFNGLRKESYEYTFTYRNPHTGRRAEIEVSCVYRAAAIHNFISTASVYAY